MISRKYISPADLISSSAKEDHCLLPGDNQRFVSHNQSFSGNIIKLDIDNLLILRLGQDYTWVKLLESNSLKILDS